MPGIFGFRLRRPHPDAEGVAERLAADLCLYEDWQRARTIDTGHHDVHLGVAWNELAPMARGASHHADHEVVCVLHGYILRTREDCGATGALAEARHAEAAVLAYRRFGAAFAEKLEGPFSLVLYDRREDALYGVTERHGLTPLYRHDGDHAIVFSSSLGPMARSELLEARIDPAAAATHLGHHHLFYRQSLLADVELQDPATVACSRSCELRCQVGKYWRYGGGEERDPAPFARKLDDLCDTLIAATDRILGLPGRPGASLSGGLDSRLMLGLAHRQGARIAPWTIGPPGARDMTVAAEICRTLGLNHQPFRASPEHLPDHAGLYATMMNGSGPLQNAFALDRCHAYRGHVEVMHNGYRGGVVLGKAIVDLGMAHRVAWWRGRLGLGPRAVSPALEDARDDVAMAAYYRTLSHQAHPRIAAWTVVPEPSLAGMFDEAVAGPLRETPPGYRLEQWTEEYGGGRHMTLVSIFADRHFFADASVFYDYDVRDRAFAIDPADRRGNRAYAAVLDRLLPDLAGITYANTGLPANLTGWPLYGRRLARRLVGRKGGGTTGLQPARWLREPGVREFCADLVHGERFRSRPWWRADAIVQDFDEALAGSDALLGELWDAITLELFARRWLDPQPEEAA
ncbi:hypothetical protein GF314_10385 [bacterium]|nr:hypothetical protein [bacterium]